MHQYYKNEALMKAVTHFDYAGVKFYLELGADPNYCIFPDEEEPDGLIQPTTPLRMVMFRISDCDLEEEHLKEFLKITQLLLENGADPKPALKIAEDRYGKYKPEEDNGSTFLEVYRTVAQWDMSQQ